MSRSSADPSFVKRTRVKSFPDPDSSETRLNTVAPLRKKIDDTMKIFRQGLGTQLNPIALSDSDSDTDPPTLVARDSMPSFGRNSHVHVVWTAELCLERALEVFPDVSHKFVLDLWQSNTAVATLGERRYQTVLNSIMEHSNYPKEQDERKKLLQSVRQDAVDPISAADLESRTSNVHYQKLGMALLKHHFPDVSVSHIKITLQTHKSVYKAYLELCKSADLANTKIKQPRKPGPPDIARLDPLAQGIHVELEKARIEGDKILQAKQAQKRSAQLEEANDFEARRLGDVGECGCCFDDVPLNRMVGCNAIQRHQFCFDCVIKNVETEIGNRKCRPQCMDMSACSSGFEDSQLRRCVCLKTMDRLLRLQQQEELKIANIDGLTECPFCDYMAICPSALVDREFRCENPDCGMVSCRLCNHETHTPLSCERAARERAQNNKIEARHVVEEAMTEAMVRNCNKCKGRFVKIDGCNKMTCPTCGNAQCYVCSATIQNYEHFGNGNGKCPQTDTHGVEVRHQEEVKKAEEAALIKIRAERPELTEEDLAIKVSDEVLKAEKEKAAAQPAHRPFPMYHWDMAQPGHDADVLRDMRAQLRQQGLEIDQQIAQQGRHIEQQIAQQRLQLDQQLWLRDAERRHRGDLAMPRAARPYATVLAAQQAARAGPRVPLLPVVPLALPAMPPVPRAAPLLPRAQSPLFPNTFEQAANTNNRPYLPDYALQANYFLDPPTRHLQRIARPDRNQPAPITQREIPTPAIHPPARLQRPTPLLPAHPDPLRLTRPDQTRPAPLTQHETQTPVLLPVTRHHLPATPPPPTAAQPRRHPGLTSHVDPYLPNPAAPQPRTPVLQLPPRAPRIERLTRTRPTLLLEQYLPDSPGGYDF